MKKGASAGDLCEGILAAMGQEILLVGPGGGIAYANRAAHQTFGIDDDGRTTIETVLTPPDANWKGRMRTAAQSSTMVPMNLTVRGGEYAGMEMKFRARGFRDPQDGRTLLMLIADRERDAGFSQLRKLVRDLNAELAQRKTLQNQLEATLETEQRLHGELIHRVKNNLALLNSLVHHRQGTAEHPETVEALEMLEGRIHAIRAVHELLDRAGEIDWVQAGALIEELCRQLDGSLTRDNVTIENELLDVRLHVRDATPLSLLINELITNALKHAFPDDREGKVEVALKKNGEDKLEVRVADNGRGIMEGGETGSGSRIVQALARQIGGTLDRHSDGDGTKWTFVFPYRQEEHRSTEEITLGVPPVHS